MSNETQTSKYVAKTYSALISGINTNGVVAIGQAIGHDPSFVSRLKAGEKKLTLMEVSHIIPASGYELYSLNDTNMVVCKKKYQALCAIGEAALNKITDNVDSSNETVNIPVNIYESLKYLAQVGVEHLESAR